MSLRLAAIAPLGVFGCSLVYTDYDDYGLEDTGAASASAGGSTTTSASGTASGGAGGGGGSATGAAGGAAGCGALTNLVARWVASDIQDHAPGEDVITWSDSTGQGHDLEATVYAPGWQPQGIAGQPVVRFNGVDPEGLAVDLELSEIGGPNVSLTVFAVVDAASTDGSRAIWSYGEPAANDDGMFFEHNFTGVYLWAYTGLPDMITNKAEGLGETTDEPVVWTTVKGATDLHIYKSGDEVGSLFNGAPIAVKPEDATLVLGDRNAERPWNGDIAEVLVYSGVLAKSDRESVESCLGRRYAIPVVH